MKKRKDIRASLTGRQIDAMTPAQRQKLLDDLARSTPHQRRAESTTVPPQERARLVRADRRLAR